MTTNEQKCPVCECEMDGNDSFVRCTNKECPDGGVWVKEAAIDANKLIQLRIDKEKAAAVIAERERKLSDLTDDERMDIFCQYCTSCGRADPRCQCWNDD